VDRVLRGMMRTMSRTSVDRSCAHHRAKEALRHVDLSEVLIRACLRAAVLLGQLTQRSKQLGHRGWFAVDAAHRVGNYPPCVVAHDD